LGLGIDRDKLHLWLWQTLAIAAVGYDAAPGYGG